MSMDLSQREATENRPDSNQPKNKSLHSANREVWIWAFLGATLLSIIWAVVVSNQPSAHSNIIEISGRIEAPETYITSGVATRVQSVRVREGDTVLRGQVLLTLDSSALKVKMQATDSEEMLAKQAQDQADQQVRAAQLDVDKARAQSKGFFAKIFSSKKKKEEVTARLTNEMKTAQMQLFQAKVAVIKSHAARGEVSSKAPFFTITSPIDGLCVTRSIEPGETIAPGQVLMSIIDPAAIYMKGFVPEGNLSQIKIGQAAEVILDSPTTGQNSPPHKLKGTLTAIDTAASFTPQNIYFKEDRIKQVFGIKITIDHPDGSAKPGMSADATISVKQDK